MYQAQQFTLSNLCHAHALFESDCHYILKEYMNMEFSKVGLSTHLDEDPYKSHHSSLGTCEAY